MIIVVDSRSGFGQKFADKLGYPTQTIDTEINGPCVLVTRNVGVGRIPPTTLDFLDKHADKVVGVVVNGMKRYGPFYCKAADKIHKQYGIKIFAKIELAGTDEDVDNVRKRIHNVEL